MGVTSRPMFMGVSPGSASIPDETPETKHSPHMLLTMLWRRRPKRYDPHNSDSEVLRRWAVEQDSINARLQREWRGQRRQARRRAVRDAVRTVAFFLVSAAIAATVAGVIDNAGSGG